MDPFQAISIAFIIIIGLGLGAATTKEDFQKSLAKPKAVVIGLSSQYCFMPLIAFALAKAFNLPDDYAAGVILVGCSPGGTTSNIFTYWSKGNVALSIVMSFCSTLAAFAMLPLLIFLLLKLAYGASIEIPWANIFISLILVVVPCMIGLSVRHYNTEWKIGGKLIWQWMELLTTIFGLIFFIAAVVAAFLFYHEDMGTAPAALWIIAFLMEPVGALFGYSGATLLGLDRKDCRTIGIETGVQSFTLTMAIIVLSFSGEDRDKALIFPILYGVMYLVNSAWIVFVLRYLVAPLDNTEEDEAAEKNDADKEAAKGTTAAAINASRTADLSTDAGGDEMESGKSGYQEVERKSDDDGTAQPTAEGGGRAANSDYASVEDGRSVELVVVSAEQ